MLKQRRDANEALIIEALLHAGAHVIRMDKSAGFDLLVISPRGVNLVEVKDPSQRWTLTENEARVKRAVELAGGPYYIVETVEEAIGLAMNDMPVVLNILSKEVHGELQPC